MKFEKTTSYSGVKFFALLANVFENNCFHHQASKITKTC